jgi:hypothetical protein
MYLKIKKAKRTLMVMDDAKSSQDVILTTMAGTKRIDMMLTREEANKLARTLMAHTV